MNAWQELESLWRHFIGDACLLHEARLQSRVGTSANRETYPANIDPNHNPFNAHHSSTNTSLPPLHPLYTVTIIYLVSLSGLGKQRERRRVAVVGAVRDQLSTSICGYATSTDWTASAPSHGTAAIITIVLDGTNQESSNFSFRR